MTAPKQQDSTLDCVFTTVDRGPDCETRFLKPVVQNVIDRTIFRPVFKAIATNQTSVRFSLMGHNVNEVLFYSSPVL